MNVIVKRRQLIIATLVVALGAAVFVNWYYTGNRSLKEGAESPSEEYVQNLGEAQFVNATEAVDKGFEEMKLQRQKNHDEALDKLNESLKNAQTGSDEAKSITESINNLSSIVKQENDVEALINTELKTDSYIVISDDSARVLVTKGKLNEETAIKIFEIVTANTKIPSSNITIAEN